MSRKLRSIVFYALFAQLFVAGCATYTSTLTPNTNLDPAAGYLYGRFTIGKPVKTGLLPARLRAGLTVEAENGDNNYAIQFEVDRTPSAIAVKPGTYILKKLTFATGDYIPSGEKNLPEGPLTAPFKVEAGRAYYLADFDVTTRITSGAGSTIFSWQLSSVSDDYETTTAELKKSLPQFESIPTSRAVAR